MPDDVKPALTAEEWEGERFETCGADTYDLTAWRDAGAYHISAAHCGCEISREHFHKLAALALHGQPFGFTREDVWWIRAINENWAIDFDGLHKWAASMQSRIEALLPPEDRK